MRCGHARAVSTFLDLLYDEAPRADYDALVTSLVAAGADPEATRRECDVALRLRDLVARQRAREAELSALYETAHDLTALRDVDAVLSAMLQDHAVGRDVCIVGEKGSGKSALLRQFCARGLLAVDDRRGDACVDKAGTFAGCPPGCAAAPG